MPAPQVQALMRSGEITSICERGEGEHAGLHRLSFFYKGRHAPLSVDESGRIIQRSLIDCGERRPTRRGIAGRIAVIQGAPGTEVQALFRDLVERWRPTLRIAGVVAEDHGLPDRMCAAGYLRSIVSGTRYPIFQDLGPGAAACHLDGDGAATAAMAVERDIAAGCDLVLLSKFGKLEAARRGLTGAFLAAMAAGKPVLTSVSPALERAWAEFASPLFVALPADAARVEAWWRTVRTDAPAPPAQ